MKACPKNSNIFKLKNKYHKFSGRGKCAKGLMVLGWQMPAALSVKQGAYMEVQTTHLTIIL